jgi:hypothetical protein
MKMIYCKYCGKDEVRVKAEGNSLVAISITGIGVDYHTCGCDSLRKEAEKLMTGSALSRANDAMRAASVKPDPAAASAGTDGFVGNRDCHNLPTGFNVDKIIDQLNRSPLPEGREPKVKQ